MKKRVLITGASSGIGKACSILFYDHGAITLHNRLWNNWNSENENLENNFIIYKATIISKNKYEIF